MKHYSISTKLRRETSQKAVVIFNIVDRSTNYTDNYKLKILYVVSVYMLNVITQRLNCHIKHKEKVTKILCSFHFKMLRKIKVLFVVAVYKSIHISVLQFDLRLQKCVPNENNILISLNIISHATDAG
jgi:hypothetical protein